MGCKQGRRPQGGRGKRRGWEGEEGRAPSRGSPRCRNHLGAFVLKLPVPAASAAPPRAPRSLLPRTLEEQASFPSAPAHSGSGGEQQLQLELPEPL